MRLFTRLLLLVALWLLAWGEVTVANVLSGTAVAAVLLVVFPPTRQPRGTCESASSASPASSATSWPSS